MDKFVIKQAILECTARPTEDNTSTTTVTTAIKPTNTNDDYNCLNNVQSSASAITTVVESAQCSTSNSGGHENSSGVEAQKTKQKRDVGRRTFRQEWPIKYPWLLYDMPTERVFAMCAKKPRIETCSGTPTSPTLPSFRQVSATGSMLQCDLMDTKNPSVTVWQS